MRSARGEVVAILLMIAALVVVFAVREVADRPTKPTSTTPTPSRPTSSSSPTRPSPSAAPSRAPSPSPTPAPQATPWATVLWVSDGDTVQVSLYGTSTPVRLLNIDTPEVERPDAPAQCLGAEASASLKELLPRGTRVTLAFDWRRYDTFGRRLAVVRVGERDVSTIQASRGFTAAIVVQGNDRFLAPVAKAQASAIRNARGLYDPTISCTKAGRVRAAVKALSVPKALPAGTAARRALANDLRGALTKAQALDAWLARYPAGLAVADRERYPADYRSRLRSELAPAMAKARATLAGLG